MEAIRTLAIPMLALVAGCSVTELNADKGESGGHPLSYAPQPALIFCVLAACDTDLQKSGGQGGDGGASARDEDNPEGTPDVSPR